MSIEGIKESFLLNCDGKFNYPKNYYTYNWKPTKMNLGFGSIFELNIYTTTKLENEIYISKSEFLELIFPIIDCVYFDSKIIKSCFDDFIKNYLNNLEIRKINNKNITLQISNFLFNKLGINDNNIQKSSSFFSIEGRNTEFVKQIDNYIDLMKDDDNEIIIFEIIFAQKPFLSRFIMSDEI